MRYDFDTFVDRRNSRCTKWDNLKIRMSNEKAWPMWVADTDFKCSEPILKAIRKRASHPLFGYSFVPPEFYECVKAYVQKRHNWSINTSDVIYFPGIVPFLALGVRALTEPKDEVAILPPVYHPFRMMVEANDRVPASCPLVYDGPESGYRVDYGALEAVVSRPSVKLLIMCNPHNPVGKVYTEEELRRIGDICIRNNVPVLSDEIHSDIIFKGYRHIPMASLSEELAQNTITCISPSKAYNVAGLKASAIIVHNSEFRKKVDYQINATHVSTPNVFCIDAFMAAYNESTDYLEQEVAYIESNYRILDEWLASNTPKIKLVKAHGTYLMWLDCSELGLGSSELQDFFVQDAALAVNSGSIFGNEGDPFVRINIACPKSTMMHGLELLKSAYVRNGF